MSYSSKNASLEEEKQVRNKKKLIVLAAIGVMSIGLVISHPLRYPQTEYTESQAPDFSLLDIDGNNFTLSSQLGKVVVLNFMATWCRFCISEISELNSVWEFYSKTIVIASISIETNEQIRTFRNSHPNATWIWMRDTASVANAYHVYSIPKTVIIDKNGNTAFTHTRLVTSPTLIIEIEQLLG